MREGAGSISELNLKARDIFVEEEDSVALFRKQRDPGAPGRVQVAVVLLGRMSNFTDFDTLGHDPRAHLFYTHGRGRNPGRANRGVPRHGPPAS